MVNFEIFSKLIVKKFKIKCFRCGETLVLGFRGFSYTLLNLNGVTKELFPTGKSPEPSITKLSDNTFALGKDSQSIFMDTNGELIQHNPVKWSDSPSVIGSLQYIMTFFLVFYSKMNLLLFYFFSLG